MEDIDLRPVQLKDIRSFELIGAFVMANVLGISYWRLCIAAILPAILYYTALYGLVVAGLLLV